MKMPRVMIQPSYGNPAARRHWGDTLDREVRFDSDQRLAVLTPGQLDALVDAHPARSARFWGATAVQDKNMARLATEDVVLFTGRNIVRGIGEVGVIFQNSDFADTLWTPDAVKGSWRNVYSLLSFRAVEIPYAEIWELPSFNPNDNFMGLRILDDIKSAEVLEGLGISTAAENRTKFARDYEVATAIANRTQIVPVEKMHTSAVKYRQINREIEVRRAESLLSHEYQNTLRNVRIERVRTAAGLSDIHVTGPEGTEIIEVKSGSDRNYVRAALAQLLDYAPHSPVPVGRLSALFPTRPASGSVEYLHRYGIDCVFRVGPGVFERATAPDDRRKHMRDVWSPGGDEAWAEQG
jgi:hypothetical protein